MSQTVRVYGSQCARCGTVLLVGEADSALCAPCESDEAER